MLTNRITEGEKVIFLSHYRAVFALVGLMTLKILTLDFAWLM